MPFSTVWEYNIMNGIFGGTAISLPSTMYMGLSSTPMDGTETDTTILAGEPASTGSYARVSITNNATNWPAATGGEPNPTQKVSGPVISFPVSSAAWTFPNGDPTGTQLVTFFFADAATLGGGNLIWYDTAGGTAIIVAASLVTVSFPSGSINLSLQ